MPPEAEPVAGRAAYIESLADICPSNAYLEKCFSSFLTRNGYRLVGSKEDADVVVMNGCNANSANPETALRYADFAAAHRGKTVLVAGCAPVYTSIEPWSRKSFHEPWVAMKFCKAGANRSVMMSSY